MSLATYHKKRHFKRTPEPKGRAHRSSGKGLRYLIQKHDASRLHYDFRLEWDGVLKSWAVPKGPSLDPSRKVLAVQVEDHPIEYADFEGVIPEGEYGGGTVLLWDRGTWEPLSDVDEGLESGKLHFILHGEKHRGEWGLVRMHGDAGGGGKNWLLFKVKDKYASTSRDVLADEPKSVKTRRSLERIAGDRDEVWSGDGKKSARVGKSGKAKLPGFISPELAVLVERPPSWVKSKGTNRQEKTMPVKLTHPDKLLFVEEKVTKQKLAEYYQAVAEWMLPHVVDRPLALVRCPNGMAGKCFFQRNWSETMPAAIGKVEVGDGKKTERHVTVHDLDGIISLVQMGVLEIHTWNCTTTDIEHPDQLIFDLDPGPDVAWKRIVEGARKIKEMLDDLKLPAFLKTTGGKGLHITIPIEPNIDWDSGKSFCKTIANALVEKDDGFVANMRKDLRGGKIFIDFNRNGHFATAVAPYSSRAREGATVSMPIGWEELGRLKSAGQFTVNNAVKFIEKRKNDPWSGFEKSRVDLRKIVEGRGGGLSP